MAPSGNRQNPYKNGKLSIRSRLSSIGYACKGIVSLLRSEPNAWLHAIATFVVITCGVIKNLNRVEWCLIALAIGIVWVAEAINTAIEKLCDLYTETFHPLVKSIKDIAAAGVLLAAATSAVIGIIVFFF
jgi:diacylglycerol kinase (ATP)